MSESDPEGRITNSKSNSNIENERSTGRATRASIAEDELQYLQENPTVCAEGNVNGWRWLRYHDGEWQATDYGGPHRLTSYVNGKVLTREEAKKWLKTKPIKRIPTSEAYQWKPKDKTVWEEAEEQEVFKDVQRCFYCGKSENAVSLSNEETTDHGELDLCKDCKGAWNRSGELEESNKPTSG